MLQGSDVFVISRAGTLYKLPGSEVLAYVLGNVGTGQYQVADIAARNALNAQMSLGDRVIVEDATGDATVGVGWAIYVWLASNTWRKVAEQEGLDVTTGATDLSYTAGATQGIVVSSTGNDATIPAADAVNAGLMLPAHKAKLDFLTLTAAFDADAAKAKLAFITVTQAVDLDAIEAASHAAVTTAGTAATNPISVAGQVLSFNIAALDTAP